MRPERNFNSGENWASKPKAESAGASPNEPALAPLLFFAAARSRKAFFFSSKGEFRRPPPGRDRLLRQTTVLELSPFPSGFYNRAGDLARCAPTTLSLWLAPAVAALPAHGCIVPRTAVVARSSKLPEGPPPVPFYLLYANVPPTAATRDGFRPMPPQAGVPSPPLGPTVPPH